MDPLLLQGARTSGGETETGAGIYQRRPAAERGVEGARADENGGGEQADRRVCDSTEAERGRETGGEERTGRVPVQSPTRCKRPARDVHYILIKIQDSNILYLAVGIPQDAMVWIQIKL